MLPLIGLAAIALAGPVLLASAHTVTLNGDTADWFSRAPITDNTGIVARDSSEQGENIWRDPAGDERHSFANPDPRVDLTQLRYTATTGNLFILADLGDVVSVRAERRCRSRSTPTMSPAQVISTSSAEPRRRFRALPAGVPAADPAREREREPRRLAHGQRLADAGRVGRDRRGRDRRDFGALGVARAERASDLVAAPHRGDVPQLGDGRHARRRRSQRLERARRGHGLRRPGSRADDRRRDRRRNVGYYEESRSTRPATFARRSSSRASRRTSPTRPPSGSRSRTRPRPREHLDLQARRRQEPRRHRVDDRRHVPVPDRRDARAGAAVRRRPFRDGVLHEVRARRRRRARRRPRRRSGHDRVQRLGLRHDELRGRRGRGRAPRRLEHDRGRPALRHRLVHGRRRGERARRRPEAGACGIAAGHRRRNRRLLGHRLRQHEVLGRRRRDQQLVHRDELVRRHAVPVRPTTSASTTRRSPRSPTTAPPPSPASRAPRT